MRTVRVKAVKKAKAKAKETKTTAKARGIGVAKKVAAAAAKTSVVGGVRISKLTGLPVRPYRKTVDVPASHTTTRRAKAGGRRYTSPLPVTIPVPEIDPNWGIENLAKDMLLAAMHTSGRVPQGEDVRHIVRQAREFYSELATPTTPKFVGPRVDEMEESEDEVGGPSMHVRRIVPKVANGPAVVDMELENE